MRHKPQNNTDNHFQVDKSAFSTELPDWINETFYYLENNAVYRDKIDWNYERQTLINLYLINSNDSKILEAVQTLVQKAGSNHSFLIYHSFLDGVDDYQENIDKESVTKMSFKLIDKVFGYISIPTYYGVSKELEKQLNIQITTAIHQAESHNIQGFIIDLSENEGGNMYPPLTALTPILTNGDLGFFYDPINKTRISWAHENGIIQVRDSNEVYISFKNESYFISPLRDIPKAILIGNKTGSSGEFILLSLTSQKNTKLFGQKTAGFSTGNEIFKLSDGSKLILTTVFSMDTKGNIYNDSILPDVATDDWDSAKTEAIKWLLSSKM